MKNNTKSTIVRPITVMTKQIRQQLGFPFIDVHQQFVCELGMRDFERQGRIETLPNDKNYLYKFVAGYVATITEKRSVDKKATPKDHQEFIEHAANISTDVLFQVRNVTIADDRSVSAQVVWTPDMNPVGKGLLETDVPNFYFSPIIISCKGMKFASMIAGFDVLRK